MVLNLSCPPVIVLYQLTNVVKLFNFFCFIGILFRSYFQFGLVPRKRTLRLDDTVAS